jgi:deoxyribodipyrimidine photolyase-related protein
MLEATVIYPHQLFPEHPALKPGRRVYLVEEQLLLTYNPIHIQKLILHKLTLDAYQEYLISAGYSVTRLTLAEYQNAQAIFVKLQTDAIATIHVVDTTDTYLEAALANSNLERIWYESPLFLLPKNEAIDRYSKSKQHMARFYKQLRIDKQILITDSNEPIGGQWSFDEDNRKKIPKHTVLPIDITVKNGAAVDEAAAWARLLNAEIYGEPGCWLPTTHTEAKAYLQNFLQERFAEFGTYEDAMHSDNVRLWHSTLSPLLNIGLLTPRYVLDTALSYAKEHKTPLNSLEGFIRQILGWREFIRASYERDGSTMRQQNFFAHIKKIPPSFWDGTTNIFPVDDVINKALQYGYNHHIERLMVLGNIMLLSQYSPHEVYRWFMGMYIDSYDWVMVPNVYGMSQFADGGSFATKPYISGSNYIKKMSHYPAGDWEELWTALYWNFISTHKEFFSTNHRLSMMPRLLEKMDSQKRNQYLSVAADHLNKK